MKLRLFLVLYTLLFPLAFLLYLPIFVLKLIRRGGWREGFSERFGWFSPTKRQALEQLSQPIWIHAVSVGEVNAALTLIHRWTEREPDRQFVLSTTTTTGQALARRRAPENVTPIYFPLDFYPCTRAALNRVKPAMLVLFEVEIWPAMIVLARARNIPVTTANSRLSDHSAAGYRRHRWLFANLFRLLRPICVQSEEDARRMRDIIGETTDIHVCNTMKFDQVPDQDAQLPNTLLNRAFGDGPRLIFTAASTHPGEEAIILQVWRELTESVAHLCLILVPRHAERTAEVENLLREKGGQWNRLSSLLKAEKTGEPASPTAAAPILLVDTTGDLMSLLAVSDVVFVGKSLSPNHGGHNTIEPAIFGRAVVHGPNMENFRLVTEIFQQRQAVLEVADAAELTRSLRDLLNYPEKRQKLGDAARATVEANRGATDRTIDLFLQRLHPVATEKESRSRS